MNRNPQAVKILTKNGQKVEIWEPILREKLKLRQLFYKIKCEHGYQKLILVSFKINSNNMFDETIWHYDELKHIIFLISKTDKL
jgi:hypothetical protein